MELAEILFFADTSAILYITFVYKMGDGVMCVFVGYTSFYGVV